MSESVSQSVSQSVNLLSLLVCKFNYSKILNNLLQYGFILCVCRRRMAVMKFAQLEHTKMLFPAATEMVPSHPTDPVELRRLHYQTPGCQETNWRHETFFGPRIPLIREEEKRKGQGSRQGGTGSWPPMAAW